MSYKGIDITNQRFGKLVALTKVGKQNNNLVWNCVCDCGNYENFSLVNLKRGEKIHCKFCKIKVKQDNAMEHLFTKCKSSASHRDLIFNLSFDHFKILIKRDCTYCGIPASKPFGGKHVKIYVNGIDRIDSKIGYEINNCVPCCHHCNYAKSYMTLLEFFNWSRQFVNHQLKLAGITNIFLEKLNENDL